MILPNLGIYAFCYVVVKSGLVKPSLVCSKLGEVKYLNSLLSNLGSPFFLLLYLLAGGRFGEDNFYCLEFSQNSKLDLYLLFAVQWINAKNVLDTFLTPLPSTTVVLHHIVIFMVTFSAICFDAVRQVAGVQASNIACMELGSVLYCLWWYWPKPRIGFIYYWGMTLSNIVAAILVAYQQTLRCASTKYWPPYLWVFMVVSAYGLIVGRQNVARKNVRPYGTTTIEGWLMPSFFSQKDLKTPAGGPKKGSISTEKSE